jgi:hypothetical protein
MIVEGVNKAEIPVVNADQNTVCEVPTSDP